MKKLKAADSLGEFCSLFESFRVRLFNYVAAEHQGNVRRDIGKRVVRHLRDLRLSGSTKLVRVYGLAIECNGRLVRYILLTGAVLGDTGSGLVGVWCRRCRQV